MFCGDAPFGITDIIFANTIPIENFDTPIVVIDKNNEHADLMMALIKNKFYPYLDNNIWVTFQDVESKDLIKDCIICAPFSADIVDINFWNQLIKDNIVIAAVGEEGYPYPACLPGVYKAAHSIHWGCNLNNRDVAATGTSVYAAFLSILALNGKEFLEKFIKQVDNFKV